MGRLALCVIVAGVILQGCARPHVSPAAPKNPLVGLWHRVETGETTEALAERYQVPVDDIEEINGVEHAEALQLGRMLFIPGVRQKELSRSAPTTQPAAGQGTAAQGIVPTLAWPVRGGRVTNGYGGRRQRGIHEGIDIVAREGSSVYAAADGVVIYAGSGVRGYGNLVLVRHGGGLVTVYAHNRRNLVQEGAAVRRGQTIAEVGHTGRADGDHLHFELRRGELPEDPLPRLPSAAPR